MNRRKKGLAVLWLCLLFGFWGAFFSRASEPGNEQGSEMEMDLSQIQEFLSRQESTRHLSMEQLIKELMAGEIGNVAKGIMDNLYQELIAEMKQSTKFIFQAAGLGFLGAVFTAFSQVFPGQKISETGFFITYLLCFTCFAASFFHSMEIAAKVAAQVLEFLKILFPAFFLSVAFAGGSLSAAALYGSILTGVNLAGLVCQKVFLPLVKVYILLLFAGNVSKEEILSNMTKNLESLMKWGLRTLAGIFLGIQMVQTMILPYADSVKRTGVQKIVSAIPGVGGTAEAVIQMTIGSGVLMKNTIGAGAVVILVVLTAVPLVKLLFFLLLYKGLAIVLEPVCDKRITACAQGLGTAHRLLLELVLIMTFLFALSIGLICGATNAVYFGG